MAGAGAGGRGLRLVERDDEVDRLDRAFDEVAVGRGVVVAVEGPAGIGKSVLLGHVRHSAVEGGGLVLAAAGDELESEFAFGAVLQLFEPVLRTMSDGERARALDAAGPVVGSLLAGAPGEPADAHEAARGLLRILVDLAAAHRLLVVADDIQWWDEPSLRFLAYLARRVDQVGAAVVVAARQQPGGPAPTVAAALGAATHRLQLQPLSPRGVAEVVASSMPDAPPDVVDAIAHASGGNPFLVSALAHEVADASDPGTARRVASLTPASVLEHVVGRLRVLPALASEVAGAIAVLGDEAYARHVSSLLEVPRHDVDAAARQLVDAHLIVDEPPLRFAHPLLRSAVYDATKPDARGALHRCAGRVLLDAGTGPERVAHHLLEAPRTSETWIVEALRAAAARARASGAPNEAVRYLRRALDEPPPPADLPAVLVELGQAETVLAPELGIRRFEAALEAVDERSPACGQIHGVLARVLLATGQTTPARQAFEHALSHDPVESDTRLALEVGWVVAARNNLTTRLPARRRLVELTDRAPAGRTKAERALLAELAYEAALAGTSATTTAELARRAIDDDGVVSADDWLTAHTALLTLTWAGDLQRAADLVEAMFAVAERRGHRHVSALAHHLSATVRYHHGEIAAALGEVEHARDLLGDRRPLFVPGLVANHALLLFEHGCVEDASAALELPGGEEPWETTASFHFHLYVHAMVELGAGRYDAALALGRRCEAFSEAMGTWNPTVMDWREPQALALAALGRPVEARRLADKNVVLARRFGAPRHMGRALRVLAAVLDPASRPGLLRDALEHFVAAGDALGQAAALADLAALGTDLVPDAERHRVDAATIAERIGAGAVARRVAAPAAAAPAVVARRANVSVRVLGDFAVTCDGDVRSGPPAAARLVKVLALARRPRHLEELTADLWPDEGSPDRARARLRSLLAKTRAAYGDVVRRDGDVLTLAERVDVDLWRFDDGASAAFRTAAAGDGGVETLATEALPRAGGELLPGDLYAPWTAAARERVRQQQVDLLELLVESALRRDDHDVAASYLTRAAELEPLDDERHERLAGLLDTMGRYAAGQLARARAAEIRAELGLG